MLLVVKWFYRMLSHLPRQHHNIVVVWTWIQYFSSADHNWSKAQTGTRLAWSTDTCGLFTFVPKPLEKVVTVDILEVWPGSGGSKRGLNLQRNLVGLIGQTGWMNAHCKNRAVKEPSKCLKVNLSKSCDTFKLSTNGQVNALSKC